MKFDIAVVGLGYVGLPLAVAASGAGLHVAGFDHSDRLVFTLAGGASHIDDLSDADIRKALDEGFFPTDDEAVLADAQSIVICVPTPLSPDGGPDLTAVRAAVAAVARHLRPGQLVVLESTTYPGTTEDVVKPALEASGLECGKDFYLAFSPERIDPGNQHYGVRNTPKVVGGCDHESTEMARALYQRFIDHVVTVPSAKEAEMAKLLENTYRHVNIALVNEMARFCHDMDIDLWAAIRAAATKPFGFQAFYPGPGVGGHCIPIDPNYLSHRVRSRLGYSFKFVELAQEINLSMPSYVARRLQDILNEDGKSVRDSKVLLLGVTYKPNISDDRETPAAPLQKILRKMGADVSFSDPHIDRWRPGGQEVRREDDPSENAGTYDLVVLLQPHTRFDLPAISARAHRFFDTRGVPGLEETAERL